jgi:riboflavin transporter FmnP
MEEDFSFYRKARSLGFFYIRRKKMKNTRLITLIGIMTALSFVLYLIEIPVGFLFPSAPFLQIDFSDVPAILLSIAYGPFVGIIIGLFKNVLHFIFKSQTPAASGEIANFFAGIAYLLPISIYYFYNKKNKSFKLVPNIILLSIGTLLTALVMILINFNITLPLYGISGTVEKWAFVNAITPFNVFKGVLLGIVTILIYPRLSKFLLK